MTPLPAAPQATSPFPAPAPARSTSPSVSGEDSFALLLEQGQPVLEPDAAGAHEELLVTQEDLPADPLALPGMPTQQPLQPGAPWPPAGLAGLLLSPADGDAGTTPGPMPLPAAAATAAAAAAAEPLPDPDIDTDLLAATRLAAPGVDATGGEERAEPAPTALALAPQPASAPLREAAPMLAAPAPTPDVRAGDFGERFGAQLQWMAGQQIGHARIRVHPQELGPVEVMLRLDGERISADFISAHAETRQTLEQGLPRLRDLLGEQGFQLAHAGVGNQSSSSPDDGDTAPGTAPGPATDAEPVASGEPAPVRTIRGLLDAYA